MSLKIGIVGCGQIATVHIPYIQSYPGARIVGVTDPDGRRAAQTAARYGVPAVCRTLGELVETQRPDVVHVLTPVQTHGPLAIQAMEAGCHVLVEEPMAVDLAEAEAMEAAARRAGVKLCVDHNHLFDPAMTEAREQIRRGAVGDVVWVEAFEGFSLGSPDNPYVQPGAADHWVHRLPGGVFQNLAPHPAYLLLAFLDPPKQLHAVALKTGRVPTSFADELRVLVAADNGLGSLGVSLSIQPFMKYALVAGTEGTIRINLSTNSVTLSRNRDLPRALQRGMLGVDEATQLLAGTAANAWQVARKRLKPYPGLGVLVERFYRSIEHGGPAPVDAAAGREVVRLLDQVWEQIGPSPASLARAGAAR
jgi:predicted dehydrogenase